MVQGNSNKNESSTASNKLPINNGAPSSIRLDLGGGVIESAYLPFRYAGGDLGLADSSEPWIYFVDDSGRKYLTHSVEWVLQNIDLFKQGRDQAQLLACAAMHYGLGAHALMGAADQAELMVGLGQEETAGAA